jgi:hypothetical protein
MFVMARYFVSVCSIAAQSQAFVCADVEACGDI